MISKGLWNLLKVMLWLPEEPYNKTMFCSKVAGYISVVATLFCCHAIPGSTSLYKYTVLRFHIDVSYRPQHKLRTNKCSDTMPGGHLPKSDQCMRVYDTLSYSVANNTFQ